MNSSALLENLKQLFAESDVDQNGILGRDEFRQLCAKIGLNREAADETFARLDVDQDNKITFDEFAAGFNQYKQQASSPSPADSKTKSNVILSRPQSSNSLGSAASRPGTPAGGQRTSARASASPVAARARNTAALNYGQSSGSSGSSSLTGTRASPMGTESPTAISTISSGSDYSSSSATAPAASLSFSPAPMAQSPSQMQQVTSPEESEVVYSTDTMDFGDNLVNGATGSGSQSSGQFGSLASTGGGGGGSGGGAPSLNSMRNMQDLLDCVQKLQNENQILTQIFFKDKREREEYINQLGEEFDQQVREVEERAHRRAKEELENEKKRLREMMQAERETLQHHYQTIERIGKMIKSSPNGLKSSGDLDGIDNIDKVKSKLEDTYMENRQLKKSLLDTKSDVAMIWKEMEKLKRHYEDQLTNAYARNNETKSECDHIKQQLNLMKDSNRKLQDASDVLTNYITDKVEPVIKGAIAIDEEAAGEDSFSSGNMFLLSNGSHSRLNSRPGSRRGSILSEYLNNNGNHDEDDDLGSAGSPGSKGRTRSFSSNHNKQTRQPQHQYDQIDTHSSTGISTNSSSLAPSETGSSGHGKPVETSSARPKPIRPSNNQSTNDQQTTTEGPANTIDENHLERRDNRTKAGPPDAKPQQQAVTSNNNNYYQSKASSLGNFGRQLFSSARTQSEVILENKANQEIRDESKSLDAQTANEPLVEPADGPPKATLNIILVGDSFVGKSSFAARFIEGSFVHGLISNCSIDFKTKAYKVDGTNYTINLWDTAGQERFRSITASYFRKADGIILMYDVTDKRSYLNVRNWMSTISDTAAENVAVLLVANKIDLRRPDNGDKCVPTYEGVRLATEYGIVFLETSVKEGTNLVPAMGRLIRLIIKNTTPAEEDNDRIRLNDKNRSFACMPKNC